MAGEVVNQRHVLFGVSAALVIGALPFLSRTVRKREENVAAMRDAAADAKDNARDQRLRTTSR